jgi:hypothetical protein
MNRHPALGSISLPPTGLAAIGPLEAVVPGEWHAARGAAILAVAKSLAESGWPGARVGRAGNQL